MWRTVLEPQSVAAACGALTMPMAVGIAAVCEIAGALTLGSGVSKNTIIKKISDLDDPYCWNCR
jgi:phosphate/sulfate permease